MSGIFISYRRADSSGYALRLYRSLSEKFGRQQVFMDIDTLQPGLDFGRALDQAVSTCDVVIALIGPGWSDARDAQGRRRLDNPEDLVRIEIATALAREDTRVIPVLVGNAAMPRADALPDNLKPLARRHNVELSDARWDYDVGRLLARIEPLVAHRRRPRLLTATIGTVLALLLIAAYPLLTRDWRASDPPPPTATAPAIALSVNVATCADGSNTPGCSRAPIVIKVQASEGNRSSEGEPWFSTNDDGWVRFDRASFTGDSIDLMVESVTSARHACTDVDSGDRIDTRWVNGRQGGIIRLYPTSNGPINCDITILHE